MQTLILPLPIDRTAEHPPDSASLRQRSQMACQSRATHFIGLYCVMRARNSFRDGQDQNLSFSLLTLLDVADKRVVALDEWPSKSYVARCYQGVRGRSRLEFGRELAMPLSKCVPANWKVRAAVFSGPPCCPCTRGHRAGCSAQAGRCCASVRCSMNLVQPSGPSNPY